MHHPFLFVYDYFKSHKITFYVVFLSLFVLFGYGAWKVKIEEDVSKFFPNNHKVEKINQIFQNSKFMEKLVFMISLKDSTSTAQPDSLIAYTEDIVTNITLKFEPYIKRISYKMDDEMVFQLFGILHDHLPIFLEDKDYQEIDSLIQPENLKEVIKDNYHRLISPAGIVLKKMIVKDPVGISTLAIKKLKSLQFDDSYEIYNNYIITRDHKHLLFFIIPSNSPNDTGNSSKLIEGLNDVVEKANVKHPLVRSLYFGAAAVAVGNAQQLRNDTILTISLMVVLLIIFLFGFMRKKRAPFIILIPVLFGGLFSLSMIFFIKGSISVLAIAAGAVILGIAVNYSLHFLSHLRHTSNVRKTIKELVEPMTIGSATTVLAFLCLQFANAGVLKDLGLFAGFSLVGAALCTLLFLPQFVKDDFFGVADTRSWVDRMSSYRLESNKFIVYFILLLTPLLFYFAQKVKFNSDMNSLNFMSKNTQQALSELNKVNEFSLRSVYIVTTGVNLEDALRKNERLIPEIKSLEGDGIIKKTSSVSGFIISDSLQRVRINKWNSYWTLEKKLSVVEILRQEGKKYKFSPILSSNFDSLLNKRYDLIDKVGLEKIRTNFFDDYITERAGQASIVTLAKVDLKDKERLYSKLDHYTYVHALDKQLLTNSFVTLIRADFNFIVTFTGILVFVALLIAYGRIEITLITFIPMLVTWVWILGIMALVGIEFNIVNVMISTFIFGLGDDYSIFIMDGLQQEYKTGRQNLPSIKTSIFLSAITTISGLGVLIFAQHPALRSIAAVSIIGIVSVFVMSQTLEPFFFRLMISGPASRKHTPRTLWGSIKSFIPYIYFTIGAFLLTIIGFITLKVWPFNRDKMKYGFHVLLEKVTGWIFPISLSGKRHVIYNGQSLENPAIIIANHQSILDILGTVALTPKIVLITNDWVWDSRLFGWVVKLAEYYPAGGIESKLGLIRERMKKGYSILIFPEGTRTSNGKLKRFHKGAFFLAEKLEADILPLVIHGSGNLIPKGEFYVDKGVMTLKFLPRIKYNNNVFGEGYSERTKSISQYFKSEYRTLSTELETPAYFRRKLISNYLFKGPVLEWYLRIKLSLEKNYQPFDRLIPKQGNILDLGCGYGFLCYMLSFLSSERRITGVDYDEEKILTANHCYSKNDSVSFICADITKFKPSTSYGTIIIADVLHYLSIEDQLILLNTAFNHLLPGGSVIVREGNTDMKQKHRGTWLSEFFSVKLLKFNKSVNDLNFMSGKTIQQEALKNGLAVEIVDDTKFTSNIIFVIRKPS